jgi:hypothetical protein
MYPIAQRIQMPRNTLHQHSGECFIEEVYAMFQSSIGSVNDRQHCPPRAPAAAERHLDVHEASDGLSQGAQRLLAPRVFS